MKKMHKPLRTLVSAAVIGLLANHMAHAAGFALYSESNGYSTGNAGAGTAAEAADASIGWYNPAGLVLIRDQQLVFGGVGVFPDFSLTGTSTYMATGFPNYTENFNKIRTTKSAFVPSLHYAHPLGENFTFGLSVVAPFGLATDWGTTSSIRYGATFTEILTGTVSPELGARLTDNFSIGGGIDIQYAQVTFNSILGFPNMSFMTLASPTALDSLSFNQGHSFGVGFHLGVMGLFNDNHTRLGLNYESKIRHTFHGSSRLTGPLASTATNVFFPPTYTSGIFSSTDLNGSPIEFPDVLTLSAYHDLTEQWAILGSVIYTGWDSVQSIQLNNVAASAIATSGAIGSVSNVLVNAPSPQGWKNAWRFAVGANYRVNPQWLLRTGVAYDQTPTVDANRDVRLPDVDRWNIAIGTRYQMRHNLAIDFGYNHLFGARDSFVNRTDILGPSTYNISAMGKGRAELVSAQLVWAIDKQPEAAMK